MRECGDLSRSAVTASVPAVQCGATPEEGVVHGDRCGSEGDGLVFSMLDVGRLSSRCWTKALSYR